MIGGSMSSSRALIFDRKGNIAVMAALFIPILLAASGGAIDFLRWNNERTQFKELADTLATRGAREFLLANSTESQIRAAVQSAFDSGLPRHYGFDQNINLTTLVDMKNTSVRVELSKTPNKALILTKFEPYKSGLSLHSLAVARGGTNVCVIALEASGPDAIYADTNADLDAPDCSIMSNSTSTSGINVSGLAKITAEIICSAGGYNGIAANYKPSPTTDCPIYENPLSARAQPTVTSCDHTDMTIGDPAVKLDKLLEDQITALITTINGSHDGTLPGYDRYDLTPGVYCGGITIVDPTADVHFAPGIYIIKDGRFIVERGARVYGQGVGFFMEGANATFVFEKNSIIHLAAPTSGPMAGLIFWESDSSNEGKTYRIMSANARELLGTIYLKKGTLLIDTFLPIADASAYTAIVVNKLEMSGSPTLVLNTDYAASPVPVPSGIGPVGGTVALRE